MFDSCASRIYVELRQFIPKNRTAMPNDESTIKADVFIHASIHIHFLNKGALFV